MRAAPCSLIAGVVSLLVASGAAADDKVTTVTLKAADGVQLKGTYFAADKPGPGLLLLHMCNSNRGAWASFAQAAADRGFHVMTLDYRGYGESEGARSENPQEQQAAVREKWPGDVDAALAFLSSRPGVDKTRIGAAGGSCGVNQATQLARRHPEVKTVVMLSGGIEPNAREYVRDTPSLPILAVASRDDGNIVQTMQWIKGWSRHPASRYVEYKAAGHGTDMFKVEAGLQPMMLDWFEAHLQRAATTAPAAAQAPAAPSRVDEFWKALDTPGGAVKAREIYDATRKKDKALVLFPEAELNQLGYQILQQGRTKDAIIVFQMNVDEYPTSANTYDSLSDAYLEDGNNAEALKYAEKTLEVLAKDTQTPEDFKRLVRESAEAKIAKLKK